LRNFTPYFRNFDSVLPASSMPSNILLVFF